jgi:hypothetical protein
MATIADMALEELMRLIDEAVDRRLERLLDAFEVGEKSDEDTRTLDEVLRFD